MAQQNTKGAYLLYGTDAYRRDSFVAKLKAGATGGCEVFDGAAVNGEAIEEALQSPALFADLFGGSSNSKKGANGPRLIWVRHGEALKGTEKLLAAWEKSVKATGEAPWAPASLVITVDNLDGRKKLHQALKREGCVMEFPRPRPEEAPALVKAMAKERGLTLAPEAAALLAMVAEESLGALDQELVKVSLYKGSDNTDTVTRHDVEAVLTTGARFDMAELVKAVMEGLRVRSLYLSTQILKSTEDTLGFVGFLTWCVKHPEKFRWNRRPAPARLTVMAKALLELDRRLKTTGLDQRVLVEAFIVEQT